MYKDEITLGKTYYFNNREVVALRMESETMVFCIAKCDITHDLTGSNFCQTCNVGGMSAHTCDDSNYEIDYIMEEISDEQVMWIPTVYLKEKPVEFQPNEKLIAEIKENEHTLKSIKEYYQTQKNNTAEAIDYLSELEDRINSMHTKERHLNASITELMNLKADREIELDTVIKIEGSDLTITAKELLSLYESKVTIDLLELGRVKNWEWYGDAIGDVDVKNEALQMLIK